MNIIDIYVDNNKQMFHVLCCDWFIKVTWVKFVIFLLYYLIQ